MSQPASVLSLPAAEHVGDFAGLVRSQLELLGEDPEREGLLRTPDRVAPAGVGVVVEPQHLCMMMRGVQKQNSSTITSALRGRFRTAR